MAQNCSIDSSNPTVDVVVCCCADCLVDSVELCFELLTPNDCLCSPLEAALNVPKGLTQTNGSARLLQRISRVFVPCVEPQIRLVVQRALIYIVAWGGPVGTAVPAVCMHACMYAGPFGPPKRCHRLLSCDRWDIHNVASVQHYLIRSGRAVKALMAKTDGLNPKHVGPTTMVG